MSSTAKRTFIAPDEYLTAERVAEFKSEYYDGRIYAMSGALRPHNLIAANFAREIGVQIRERPCELYIGDLRVRDEVGASYMYPDLAAVCGEPQFLDGEFDTLLNPSLIIEILSPSTESWDRGGKFARYRRIGSLVDYVLVTQDRPLIERFTRRGGEWALAEFDRPGDLVRLESIGCAVALVDAYAKVSFPPAEPGPGA